MTSISVQDWLAKLPADLRAIAKQLRAVARKNMPKADEFIHQDVIRYSIKDSPSDQICYIAPQKNGYVNFGFFFGAGLPDPEQLLIGEGKRLRHVKVWSLDEAKSPALAKLIVETWKAAPESVEGMHIRRKKSKV